LKEQHTDLLYSAAWSDGGEVLVYFQFEHQIQSHTSPRLLPCGRRDWSVCFTVGCETEPL
jgi:hypothetical protein